MQLSTRLFYDRAAARMNDLSRQAERLTTQASTGQRLLSPSDDSVAYQRLQGLNRTDSNAVAYGANIAMAQSILQQADTTMGSITDQLQLASELAIRANSGTLDPVARAVIADQLDGIATSIAALVASKDVRGTALFGVSGAIPIGDGQSVEMAGEAGTFLRVPGDGPPSDIAATLTALAKVLREDGDIAAGAAVALTDIGAVSGQVIGARASIGARGARVDIEAAQLKSATLDRAGTRTGIEGDAAENITTAVTELQKTMTVLSATQASFSKLSSLSLFDYLR